ncbi:MAG: nucleotidyltransferase domain-containing protein [Alkalispirochaeta sp.]
MRLTETQQAEILRTATEVFGRDVTVTLFGSRVDDTERGGDIDLLITTSLDAATARHRKIQFLVRLKHGIGDRRIDVVLQTPDTEVRDIHRVAAAEGVVIQ